jgi:hypothetical protein
MMAQGRKSPVSPTVGTVRKDARHQAQRSNLRAMSRYVQLALVNKGLDWDRHVYNESSGLGIRICWPV